MEKKIADNNSNGFAIAAFVLGIFGLLLSVTDIGGVFCLIALVLAIVALKKKQKTWMAVTGLVLCLLGIGVSMAMTQTEDTTAQGTAETAASEADTVQEQEPFSESSNEVTTTKSEEDAEHSSTEIADLESFRASCTPIDKDVYKDIMRNPDDYVGKNFSMTVQINDSRTGTIFSGYDKYYVAYGYDPSASEDFNKKYGTTIDDNTLLNTDYDMSIWLIEGRDENSDHYMKLLDDDVVTVYGTFEGLSTAQNSLTKETSEQMALVIHDADLISQ